MARRATVTGIGVVAPNGLGTAAYWSATVSGRSGIGRITRFDPASYPVRLAGEVPDFGDGQHVPGRLLAQTDRMTRLALAACDWALADADANGSTWPEYLVSVVTAGGFGGFEFGQRELEALWRENGRQVSAYQSFAWFYAVNTGQISIRHGTKGPGSVLVTEQAGGLDGLGQARRMIEAGSEAVFAGGFDSALCPWGWVAQIASGRLSTREDPARAFLPFDEEACGYIPGEGGALLVLEEAEAAAARGACSYGEIAGYGATFDPRPGSDRPPGLARAIRVALADAGLVPEQIGVVFADACGLLDQDRREAAAINEVFGAAAVPVCTPKTMTGRLCAGGAALDVATALLALRDGILPPSANAVHPVADYRLDLVGPRPRGADIDNALILARGYGGFNAALVIRKPTETNMRTKEEQWTR
jgi:act minimal PKS chain-length factor (CLF/KS beta)